MLIVIVEFVLRPGMQSKFEEGLAAMRARVKDFDGFLGEEPCQSVTDAEKQVVLFYWRDEESMATWRSDLEHIRMQQRGRDEFFSWYQIRITKVERESDWRLGG